MDANELWETVRENMMQQLSKPSFTTWIEPIEAAGFNEGNLIVKVESEFQKQWLNQRYEEQINSILHNISPEELKVVFTVKDGDEPIDNKKIKTTTARGDDLFVMINELKIRVENLEEEVKQLKE